MSAYSGLYVENAQKVMAQMLHCAVYDLHQTYDGFFRLFLQSGIAEQFGMGNPRYTVGMSGPELAGEVIFRVSGRYPDIPGEAYFCRSDAFWTGHTLAYYQWESGMSFGEIFRQVPVSTVAVMYRKYHEMDVRQAVDEINRLLRLDAYRNKIRLKTVREHTGLSQRELAELADVPVRTIQQYEQGQKALEKAAYGTVRRLAAALSCRTEDIV